MTQRSFERQRSTLGDVATRAQPRDDVVDALNGRYLETAIYPAAVAMYAAARHDNATTSKLGHVRHRGEVEQLVAKTTTVEAPDTD